jgi:predicted nucleic acid-binding protein
MGKARTRSQTQGVTLDAGALIALEKGDRRMIALLQQASRLRRPFHVPAGVMGQVWRNGSRQVTLARFFRSLGVHVEALDENLAKACGELCSVAASADVIDASVVIAARAHGDVIISSDPDDLYQLDPGARIERI